MATENIDIDGFDTFNSGKLRRTKVTNFCEFQVDQASLTYWKGKTAMNRPDAIHFNLNFSGKANYSLDIGNNYNLLKPFQWVWTPNKAILNWPLDHGLLSFGLLDSKTLYVKSVLLEVINNNSSEKCFIKMGTENTSYNIANALKELVNENNTETGYPQHDKHMFCFLNFESMTNLSGFTRFAAWYLNYPLASMMISYRCSTIKFNYQKKTFELDKLDKGIKEIKRVLMACMISLYITSILLLMYLPISVMEICAWFSQDETLSLEQHRTGYTELTNDVINGEQERDWIMSNETRPLTVLGTFGFALKDFRQSQSVIKSRLLRFIGLVILPLLMLPQLMLYKDGFNFKKTISINDILKIGSPLNFLALLAEDLDLMLQSNAPGLCGPIGVLVIYLGFGCILIVLPRSLKQVVDNGIPKSRDWSVLFFSTKKIHNMSGIHMVPTSGGYATAAALCKCNFYLLVSPSFWACFFENQWQRFLGVFDSDLSTPFKLCLYMLLPIGSILEIVLSLLLYGFPFITCLRIAVNGAVVSIVNMGHPRTSHMTCKLVILYPTLFIILSLFFYSMTMIVMQVLMFVCQVITFCLIALFTYPTVSFEYLFFSVIFIYYVSRIIGECNKGYQELLRTVVKVSFERNYTLNDIVVQDDILYLNNFTTHKIKKICLNGSSFNVPSNVIHGQSTDIIKRAVVKDGAYGIPRDLFFKIVNTYKPVRVQMLNLYVKLILLIFFWNFAQIVTSHSLSELESTTETAEIMHVVFVFVLGVLLRILELTLFNESKSVQRDIEHKRIEKTIQEYWHEKLSTGNTQGRGSPENTVPKEIA